MVRVSADAFLAKVAELYEQRAGGAKGSIAISCKSVSLTKFGKAAARESAADERVMLFRACKYGNNKHKRKYSTTVTAAGHAQFHAALSHIVKTRADAAALLPSAGAASATRVATKGKKASA